MSALLKELGFIPFPHQRECHALRLRKRFIVLVHHRRAGKTVFSVMELLLAAIRSDKQRPRFAYIAPFLKQSKTVAWEYLKGFAQKIPGVRVNESDLSITLPHNDAQVRLYGADNAEALRGIYLDGVVVDEVADVRPELWGSILRPALSDRQGWAIFIGTPKGVNMFSELFFRAQTEEGWGADLRRASETGVIPQAELDAARREMSDSQYAQEFECDFAASVDDVLLRLFEVQAAQNRVVLDRDVAGSPKVLGIDVARYGSDRSCFFPRQGICAMKPFTFRNTSTMDLSANAAQVIDRWKPDAVFIDNGGIGGAVIDRLQSLGYMVIPVDFGGRSVDQRFENKRAEMWWEMSEWVKQAGALPQGNELVQDLTAPRYTYKNARGKLALESKDDMRKRGMPSPDVGDGLALTFASPVMAKSLVPGGHGGFSPKVVFDYDPYAEES